MHDLHSRFEAFVMLPVPAPELRFTCNVEPRMSECMKPLPRDRELFGMGDAIKQTELRLSLCKGVGHVLAGQLVKAMLASPLIGWEPDPLMTPIQPGEKIRDTFVRHEVFRHFSFGATIHRPRGGPLGPADILVDYWEPPKADRDPGHARHMRGAGLSEREITFDTDRVRLRLADYLAQRFIQLVSATDTVNGYEPEPKELPPSIFDTRDIPIKFGTIDPAEAKALFEIITAGLTPGLDYGLPPS